MKGLGPKRLALILWYGTGSPHGYWSDRRGHWKREAGFVKFPNGWEPPSPT